MWSLTTSKRKISALILALVIGVSLVACSPKVTEAEAAQFVQNYQTTAPNYSGVFLLMAASQINPDIKPRPIFTRESAEDNGIVVLYASLLGISSNDPELGTTYEFKDGQFLLPSYDKFLFQNRLCTAKSAKDLINKAGVDAGVSFGDYCKMVIFLEQKMFAGVSADKVKSLMLDFLYDTQVIDQQLYEQGTNSKLGFKYQQYTGFAQIPPGLVEYFELTK
ncbi:hypothetical protein [Psittacicella hinzii]|uniref:Uncharacterized protein n=1 Tax=Psittacicella hinzii TaxID=2028575 RepID=A0A3A1YGY5_9GAMM|nr:hypothetical protein [Psittacicella hinzii]RIY37503.1 hypothetical protein CKF58_04855 [Psittacicella hinzii]